MLSSKRCILCIYRIEGCVRPLVLFVILVPVVKCLYSVVFLLLFLFFPCWIWLTKKTTSGKQYCQEFHFLLLKFLLGIVKNLYSLCSLLPTFCNKGTENKEIASATYYYFCFLHHLVLIFRHKLSTSQIRG